MMRGRPLGALATALAGRGRWALLRPAQDGTNSKTVSLRAELARRAPKERLGSNIWDINRE
jgi:hypothetical protein